MRSPKKRWNHLVMTGVSVLLLLVLDPWGIAGSEPYYQGKTISLVAATGPGGGTDLTARLCASIMPKYIPGKPKIVVRNKPGGSGSSALNPFYSRTKPDGMTICVAASVAVGLQMQKEKVVQFDLMKMSHIGHVNAGGSLIAIRTDALDRLTDKSARPVVMGVRGGTEAYNALAMWGREFLGWNIRWILGFQGAAEMELALRKGEIDMMGDSRRIAPMIDEGVVKGLAQIGVSKGDDFTRRSDFPQVPTMVEVFEKAGKKPTGKAWEAFLAYIGSEEVWKFCVAPPGTPDHVVNILSEAFGKAAKDPDFLNVWGKVIGPILDVKTGSESKASLGKVLNISPEALAYMNDMKKRLGMMK